MSRLKVTETFTSLQGEALASGWPTFFIRLTGCPLRCVWCDTAYAFGGGAWQDIEELVDLAAASGVRHVCVTGGEPLAQAACSELLTALCDRGFEVSLETSGALDIAGVDPRVSRVVDVKPPGSGESHRNRAENLKLLTARDQLKFVLRDRTDYEWSRQRVEEHSLAARCTVWFSPSADELPARQLADWIVEDRLPVRMQVQLHKLLWGGEAGR